MTNEPAFLAAIARNPTDAVLRLVYADWLDDRGDPRGELIRVEEEMRTLPVFSDRFWQLKPRRNELRDRTPATWRTALRYGTDCLPVFGHGIPSDVFGRWRLIREFTERWYGPPLPDAGGQAESVRAVERQLGRVLPPAVREWVAFVDDLQAAGGGLRDGGYTLHELNGYGVVSLLVQAEGDMHWAVRHADWGLPDPPVHTLFADDEVVEELVPSAWNRDAPRTTDFALGYMMSYLRTVAGGFGVDADDPNRLREQLRAVCPVQFDFDGCENYEAPNLLAVLTDKHGRWTLGVEVAKPMTREAVPAFLWDYARGSGAFWGLFITDEHRRPG